MRKFLPLILATLLLTGLGCKGLSAAEQQAVQPVTLTYWTVFDNVAELTRMAEAYKAQRPYVTINIRQLRYEEFDDRFVNALADDVAPDIISVQNRWLRKYRTRLANMPASVNVANIQPPGKFEKDPIITIESHGMPSVATLRNDYVSVVPSDVLIGGYIYGLPLAIDTMALYYNKEMLDKSGVPTPPTTWEELLDAVKKTTRFSSDGHIIQSGIAMGTGANIPNEPDILALLMMQKGVKVITGSAVTFASDLSRLKEAHPSLEALRFYSDFARPTKEVYTWNNTFRDAFEQFARGQSAFYIGYAFDQGRLASISPQLRYEILPIPQLNASNAANIANYWVESVVKKSKNQDVAWDFIRFMSQPENILAYSQATRQPSPLRAHVADQVTDRFIGPFAQASLTAQNWYTGRSVDVAAAALRDLADAYLEPYVEGSDQGKRDSELLTETAQKVQQSL